MFVTIVLIKPTAKIRGYLGNSFAEPHPCVFVGKVNKQSLLTITSILKEHQCNGVVIADSNTSVIPRMLQLGTPKRSIKMMDGIQIVSRT